MIWRLISCLLAFVLLLPVLPCELNITGATETYSLSANTDKSPSCPEHTSSLPCDEGCSCLCCPVISYISGSSGSIQIELLHHSQWSLPDHPGDLCSSDFLNDLFRPPRLS